MFSKKAKKHKDYIPIRAVTKDVLFCRVDGTKVEVGFSCEPFVLEAERYGFSIHRVVVRGGGKLGIAGET